MSNWLDRIVTTAVRSKVVERKASVPDGLWSKCGACEAVLYQPELLPFVMDAVTEGWIRGRTAKPLLPVHWENHWDESLDELQALYNLI